MKKLFVLLLVFMLVCAACVCAAAEDNLPNQIVDAGGTVYYDADGNKLTNATSLSGDAVVEMSKTIAPYTVNNVPVENEFVVTLNVKTQQKLLEISSDTPDSAILLVMDVSNSMDDCVICGKEENHSDHQGESEVHRYCNGTSGTEYQRISNRNSRCRYCNKYESEHNEVRTVSGAKCAYVSRLERTQIAAEDFLSEFANETGAEGNDKRMVGIVAYGSHAVNVLGYGTNDTTNWENIRTEAGMTAVMDAIDELSVANSNYPDSLEGGGTSIESGLTLARNILNAGAVSGGEIEGIDYVYTILLTDGQPTYPVSTTGNNGINSSSVEYIRGNTGTNSGSSTQEADYNDAAELARAIRGLNNNGLSKLYSICFGKVDGDAVWDLEVIGRDTVGEWLTSFSTAAYNAEAAQDANLFDAFNSVMSQIQLAAKAWKVEDWMGEHMIMGDAEPVSNGSNGTVHNAIDLAPDAADYADGNVPAFVWDILGSEPDPSSDYNKELETGTLSYTYKYRVTLDNLALSYSTTNGDEENPQNPAQAANAKATLRYAATDANGEWPTEYETGTFPVPQVKGLMGDLVFEKVDDLGQSIGAGWTFRLRIDHDDAAGANETHWEYVDAVADADGIVRFTGIPSGHDYRLLENERTTDGANYADAGDVELSLDWGTFSGLTDGNDEDTYPELVNDRLNKPATLVLEKEFAANNRVMPYGIQLEIQGTGSNSSYSARRYLYQTDANADGVWHWELTGLKPGTYIVKEMNAIDHNGNFLRENHDLKYNVSVNGNNEYSQFQSFDGVNYPQVEVTLGEDAKVTVRFINEMTRKTGKLTVAKEFEFTGTQTAIPGTLSFALTATEVADANGTALDGAKTYTLPFTYANGEYTTSATLPTGFYKIEEIGIPSIDGYTLLHVVFKDGTTSLGRTPVVEIKEGDAAALTLTLTNHYEQDEGDIHVFKAFGGSLAQGEMTDEAHKEFLKEELGNLEIKINVKQGSNTVGTMTISADTDWAGELNGLPIGEYTLEEVTDNLSVNDHIHKGYNWSVADNKVTVNKDGISRVTVTNTYDTAMTELEVNKSFVYGQDMTDETFANKTIYVYVMQDDGDPDTYDLKDTLALNADGSWTDSTELPVGTYQLYEAVSVTNENTAYVPGYTLVTEWTIGGQTQTGSSVTVTLAGHGQDTVPQVSIGLKNTYTVNDGTLTLEKQNVGNTANTPDGIQFVIKNQAGEEVKRITLNRIDGWKQSVALTPGTYTLQEVLSANPVKVDWSDNVEVDANNAAKVTIEINQQTALAVTCENDYQYTQNLTFTKLDKLTNNPIKDVEFTLEHACGNDCPGLPTNPPTYAAVKSDENGVVTFNDLLVGHTYTLTETTPAGYVTMSAMTVTVTSAGATIAGTVDNVVYNVPSEWPTQTLTFTKLSSYDQSVIEGAQFDLVHDASCCPTEIAFEPVTSDKYGKVTIANIPQNHTYTLKETVTPAGYKTMKNMLVEVTEAGDILVDDEPIPTTGLIVYNDLSVLPATITFGAIKTMDGETPKEQYTFILSYEGAEIERVHNNGGEIVFSPMLFTAEGKTVFTITEEIGDDAKVLYDKSVYTVTVTAKKGADDALKLDVSIDKDGNTYTGAIEFHNETMRELPETGDSSRFGLWLAALAIASLGFAALVRRKAARG